MSKAVRSITLSLIALSMIVLPLVGNSGVLGADHTDAAWLTTAKREDARLTDAHGYIRNGSLVLAECMNPVIPTDVSTYKFAADLTITFNIDNDSAVTFDSATDYTNFGGTVVNPAGILEDIVFKVTFNDRGDVQLATSGLPQGSNQNIRVFAGLVDDPFLTARWDSFNTAAVVIEVPLELVIKSQSTLLLWNTAKVPGFDTPFQDLDARATRSQGQPGMNQLHPNQHMAMLNMVPDVMILDTSKTVIYPNGRELDNDLTSIRAVPPRPKEQWRPNDRPFRDTFPYFATAHPPRPVV